jgi:hypothetical protein
MLKEDDTKILINTHSSTGKLADDLHIDNSFAGRIYITKEDRYTPDVIGRIRDYEKRPSNKGLNIKSLMGSSDKKSAMRFLGRINYRCER